MIKLRGFHLQDECLFKLTRNINEMHRQSKSSKYFLSKADGAVYSICKSLIGLEQFHNPLQGAPEMFGHAAFAEYFGGEEQEQDNGNYHNDG